MRRVLLRVLVGFVRGVRAYGPTSLILLALLALPLGTCAFLDEGRAQNAPCSWHEALYFTLGLFTFQGNRFAYPQTSLLRFVYFLAPTISASALLGAFARALEERGALLLRRFRGHTVICGLGNLGATIAWDQHRRRLPYVCVERNADAAEVENQRGSGDGVVVIGDMTSAEVLRRARCHHARRVFLTSPSDVANLDAAFNVRRLARQDGERRPPTIFAHVFDAGLSESLEGQLHTRDPRDAPIIPFNSYRFAAKALIGILLRDHLLGALRLEGSEVALGRTAWPAQGERSLEAADQGGPASLAEDRRRLLAAFELVRGDSATAALRRLVVVGMGRFGRSVTRELLDAASVPARFLIVDREAGQLDASDTFTPDEVSRFETYVGDANQLAARERIHAFAPDAVIICTDNDLGNLRLAVDLRRRKVRTITRMFDIEASVELDRGLHEKGIATVGLARLFRAAIPILTHERRIHACVDLDVAPTPEVDHLFYLARVTGEEKRRLGAACVSLSELRATTNLPSPPEDLALVWYRAVEQLDPDSGRAPSADHDSLTSGRPAPTASASGA